MQYKVKYEDNNGNDCILEFDSEQEAESAVNEDWNEFVNQHKALGCFYADFGNKKEKRTGENACPIFLRIFNGIKRLATAFLSWLNTLSSQVGTRLQTTKERL